MTPKPREKEFERLYELANRITEEILDLPPFDGEQCLAIVYSRMLSAEADFTEEQVKERLASFTDGVLTAWPITEMEFGEEPKQ